MFKTLRSPILAALLVFASAGAHAAVIAQGNSINSFGEDNAFSIFNDTGLDIASATLTFTNGTSVWDSNLPGQPSVSFLVNAGSSATGVSNSFTNPEPGGIADFDGFLSLVLSFTDFNAGETLIFGADIDGAPNNTGGIGGGLMIDVLFTDGSSGSAIFQAVRGELIIAEVTPGAALPEPGVFGLMMLGLAGLAVVKRRA